MIDAHTHLTSAAFDADRAQVLARARAAGVTRIALVGQDAEENRAVLAAAAAEPAFLPFLGLHPDRFADRAPAVSPREIDTVAEMIAREAPHITGIGEVGLDHWVCQLPERRALQHEAFARLVVLAQELALPLNVHSRSAGRHAIDLLLAYGARRVLMHAFDGKAAYALRGAEAGFVFSIPPSVVRSPQKQKLIRALPLHALALETDSPVLGPTREERNEPANARIAAAAIAQIKGLPEQAVHDLTDENICRVFGLSAAVAARA
ncbi:MAG: TatD family hydrolase [Candidatus Lambdaproteobacteria bacterium]|nr:TatD family hydrolase [Candidatus Lambdaproteobacteria bacterium]